MFIITLKITFTYSQVIAEGDTTLCESAAGQVDLTLTAQSYNVDLIDSGIYTDDIFGSVIDIGFDFTFYGNTYNQVVLASNNYLSFNLGNANNYCPWVIPASVPSNAAGMEETMNGILCPWQDINPGVGGNIQYSLSGDAPNRVFTVTFCAIPMFSCTDII